MTNGSLYKEASCLREAFLARVVGRAISGGSRGGSLGSDEPPFGSRDSD